jgi:hypothetical protein
MFMHCQQRERCERLAAALSHRRASAVTQSCAVWLTVVALLSADGPAVFAQHVPRLTPGEPIQIQQPGFIDSENAPVIASATSRRESSPAPAQAAAESTAAAPTPSPMHQPQIGLKSLWQQLFPQTSSPTGPPAATPNPETAAKSRAAAANSGKGEQVVQPRSEGLWQQLFASTKPRNIPHASPSELAPAVAVTPPSIAAPVDVVARGTGELLSALSARQDGEPTHARTEHNPAPSELVASASPREPEQSLFLQPFYMTNDHAVRQHAPGVAANPPSANPIRGLQNALAHSALVDQLTMGSGGSAGPNAVAGSPVWSEQAAWEQSWTGALPSMINPFTLAQAPAAAYHEPVEGAKLAAYFQEEPLPPMPPGANGTTGSNAADSSPDEDKSLAEAESVGEEPEDTSLQFLRTATVLLKPGESQFDIGINYLFTENTFPVLLFSGADIVGVEDARFRIRELTVPMQYRYGLLDHVQAFVNVPVGWANTQVSISTFEAFDNDGGIGDVDFGATIQLVEGNAEKPHLITTVSATAPTGGHPFGSRAALAPLASSLGDGFWSISADVLCIQTYDPLVFFYGVGMEHFFSRHFGSLEIEPGSIWNYTFGVGFAVNERVTLSTRFFGAYVEEARLNRQRVLGTNIEPMSLRMAATISKPCDRLVEPFVEFGLTDAAPECFIGITWTY